MCPWLGLYFDGTRRPCSSAECLFQHLATMARDLHHLYYRFLVLNDYLKFNSGQYSVLLNVRIILDSTEIKSVDCPG